MKLRNWILAAAITGGAIAPFALKSQAVAQQTAAEAAGATESADVVIYGATPGGVMTAVAAARHGATVILVEQRTHIGGIVAGGLIATDMGLRETVGGLADEFFARNKKFYIEKYGETGTYFKQYRDGLALEPSTAELIMRQMMTETGKVKIYTGQLLKSVKLSGDTIASFTVSDLKTNAVKTFAGKIVVDGTYTGDILPLAKVPFHLGRESVEEYGESLAGIRYPKADAGKADDRIMAFNYRVTATNKPGGTVPFPKPVHYDPEPWAKGIGARVKKQNIGRFIDCLASGEERFGPNNKCDLNWFDLPEANVGYVEGDYAKREAIELVHRDYAQSEMYYLQHDLPLEPDCPQAFRDDIAKWGLPNDEFEDTGHFPFQIYIREGRRMIGQSVLRQQDITQEIYKPDGICQGSYGIDCHAIRYVMDDGKRMPDQTMHYGVHQYDIPYGCLVPNVKPTNLLVPVALSTTHVAYCSLRMEPVFMMLGHAAGDAAAMALADKVSVQKVDVKKLRDELRQENAELDQAYRPQVSVKFSPEHPKVGEKVTFKLAVGEMREPIWKTSWNFSGDGKVDSETADATQSFALDKVYNVSVVVEDKEHRRVMAMIEVPVGKAELKDVTIDEAVADFDGKWEGSFPLHNLAGDRRSPDVWIGPGERYDDRKANVKTPASCTFNATLAKPGKYEVLLAYRPGKGRPTEVPVSIVSADGTKKITIDQQKETSPFPFVSLGEFRYDAASLNKAQLIVSAEGVEKGRVAVDGARWIYRGQ